MKYCCLASLTLCVMLACCIVQASSGGLITGLITDGDDQPLSNVTVMLTGPNLPGFRMVVTGSSGIFRMPQLPPGLYLLTLERDRMKTIERPEIRVSLNSAVVIDFMMDPGDPDETVVIIGNKEPIDIRSSTDKTVIDRDLTDRLPMQDSVYDAVSLPGGLTGSENVRVRGSARNDNMFVFDGMDTTDPVTGTFGAHLHADALEAVEVLRGGMRAEYGGAMGGIVNAVTRSGANAFHGILRYTKMDSDNRADNKWTVYRRLSEYEYDKYAVTFYGPVLRDKLWFVVSYNFFDESATESALANYGSYYYDTPSDYRKIDTGREYAAPYIKLTFTPRQDHVVTGHFSQNELSQNVLPGYGGTAETAYTDMQGSRVIGLEWTWLKTPSLYFVTRFGLFNGIMDSVPVGENTDKPPFYDTFSGLSYNNSPIWNENDRKRMRMSLDASYFIDDLMGAHTWKAGFEHLQIEEEFYSIIPGGASYTISQKPVGYSQNPDYYTGTDASREVLMFPGTTNRSGTAMALYVQDDWSVTDTVILNLGLRYESITYENNDGNSDVPAWSWGKFRADEYMKDNTQTDPYKKYLETAPMEFTGMIAPRIGINWDMFGSGRTVMHAFYGRYYNPFDLQLPGMFQPFNSDNTSSREQEYTGPAWTDMNRDGIPDEDHFFDDANWIGTGEPLPADWNLIDPNLKAEYTDEFTVGIQHELYDGIIIGLNYTRRESGDMIEDVGIFLDDDGNVVWTYLGGVKDDFSDLDPDKKYDPRDSGEDFAKHLYYITNASGNNRKYNGIELNARVRKDNWNLLGSYTWSKAEGSVIEGQEGFSGIAQFSGYYDTYQTSLNLFGELPWSCRHYLKMAGSCFYDITDWYEISLGVSAFWRSGYYYSKRQTPPFTYDPDHDDINDPDNWSGRPPYRSYPWTLPEGRGGYELPSYYSINVSWQNTFKFGVFGAATVIFDVDNITDNQGVLSESDISITPKPGLFGQMNGWAPPREYRLSLKYAF